MLIQICICIYGLESSFCSISYKYRQSPYNCKCITIFSNSKPYFPLLSHIVSGDVFLWDFFLISTVMTLLQLLDYGGGRDDALTRLPGQFPKQIP